MGSWQRRNFLKGALACGCTLCLPRGLNAQGNIPRRIYCVYETNVGLPGGLIELRQYGVRLLQESNPKAAIIDYITSEDSMLSEFFGTKAGIYFDPVARNRAYTDYTRIDRTFVGLGEGFVQEQASTMMLYVAGILAHEEGHVYQVMSTTDKVLENIRGYRIKYLELHADYLAGAYHAWRKKYRAGAQPWLLDDFFFELPLGGRDAQTYHGSHQDRRKAFFQGRDDFALLRAGSGPPADAAANQGLKYIAVLLKNEE